MDSFLLFIIAIIVILLGESYIITIAVAGILVYFLTKQNFTIDNQDVIAEEESIDFKPPVYDIRNFVYGGDLDSQIAGNGIVRGKQAERSRRGTVSTVPSDFARYYESQFRYNENANWWDNNSKFDSDPRYNAMYVQIR